MASATKFKHVCPRQRRRQVARDVREFIAKSRIRCNPLHVEADPCSYSQNDAESRSNSPFSVTDDLTFPNSINDHQPTVTQLLALSSPASSRSSLSSTTLSDCDSRDSDSSNCINVKLQQGLRSWAVKHNITQTAIGDLLAVLQPSHPVLPLDARTLLRTTCSGEIVSMCGGEYLPFCLLEQICTAIDCDLRPPIDVGGVKNLTLAINIDGLPLFKSSSKQLWTILGMIQECSSTKPFPIGIFCGTGKPNSLNDFLKPLINQLQSIEHDILHNGMWYSVAVGPFICDAPARAFVKCVKGHTGYFGCERCDQEGEYVAGRVTFPRTDAARRTDAGFLRMEHDEHHLSVSPLSSVRGILMVTGFPLDYMHLICLGVTKKMVKSWFSGPLSVRLSCRQSEELSKCLESLRACIPSEFSRRPRSVREIDRWKATEWRQILLYTGPVVFKGVLSESVYKHFLLLHVAVYCLTSPHFAKSHCVYASDLLKLFVEQYRDIYGPEGLVYNVHNLCHLADDCQKYGALDKISAFPFENHLKAIKSLVRNGHKPLQQLSRRYSEILNLEPLGTRKRNRRGAASLMLGREFSISTSQRDRTVLLFGDIVVCCDLLNCDDNGQLITFEGRRFECSRPLYTYPTSSSMLDIYIVGRLSSTVEKWQASSIQAKCMLMSHGSEAVCIPLQHTLL